jgi:hypothetical protein
MQGFDRATGGITSIKLQLPVLYSVSSKAPESVCHRRPSRSSTIVEEMWQVPFLFPFSRLTFVSEEEISVFDWPASQVRLLLYVFLLHLYQYWRFGNSKWRSLPYCQPAANSSFLISIPHSTTCDHGPSASLCKLSVDHLSLYFSSTRSQFWEPICIRWEGCCGNVTTFFQPRLHLLVVQTRALSYFPNMIAHIFCEHVFSLACLVSIMWYDLRRWSYVISARFI